ncbi:superinfection immunity protein [Gracilibacillus lacisalsi]|uniref:Superinfection immunity protein n=2 Tax=Gracilibacillus thailandensis TaxID=563735 RepID=A0A6N7QT64_9BACI|nr:superinfection immunity protein [Gracilibacillus lacisalsi]MRI65307.1 superinfection immunity protein [Gracilibacillus thailandensis]
MEVLLTIFVFTAQVFIYFIPSILATKKNKPNKIIVYIINLFLGWTLLGWIAALYLALKSNPGKINY